MDDAISFLKHDHRQHEELLARVDQDPSAYGALKQAIVHHVRVEELVFFPELLKLSAAAPIVREAWEEHNLVMQLLQELDSAETGSESWRAKLKVLTKLLDAHIETEERELFPKLMALVSKEQLEEICVLMKDWKYAEPTNEILYPAVPGCHHLND